MNRCAQTSLDTALGQLPTLDAGQAALIICPNVPAIQGGQTNKQTHTHTHTHTIAGGSRLTELIGDDGLDRGENLVAGSENLEARGVDLVREGDALRIADTWQHACQSRAGANLKPFKGSSCRSVSKCTGEGGRVHDGEGESGAPRFKILSGRFPRKKQRIRESLPTS